eukprot:RCo020135
MGDQVFPTATPEVCRLLVPPLRAAVRAGIAPPEGKRAERDCSSVIGFAPVGLLSLKDVPLWPFDTTETAERSHTGRTSTQTLTYVHTNTQTIVLVTSVLVSGTCKTPLSRVTMMTLLLGVVGFLHAKKKDRKSGG